MKIRSRLGRRSLLVVLVAGAAVLAVGLVLFQPWKLVVDDVVDEAAPPGLTEALAALPSGTGSGVGATPGATSATPAAGGATAPGTSAPARPGPTARPGGATPVPAGTPSRTPAGTPSRAPASTAPAVQLLAQGTFLSHEHGTTGTARVLALPDGRRILRIEDLDTSNGPDLRVWITDAPVLSGRAGWFVFDDGEHVELGRLKGNQGSQNYDLPASVDLRRLTGLTIWCDRFNVSFGAAELRRP